jgi:hypothetical protein
MDRSIAVTLPALLFAGTFLIGCKPNKGPAGEGQAPPSATEPPANVTSAPAAGAPDSSPSVSAARLLTREQIVPNELSVSVYTNTFETPTGPAPCWTYASDGLWSFRQKEILFSIKREPGKADGALRTDTHSSGPAASLSPSAKIFSASCICAINRCQALRCARRF